MPPLVGDFQRRYDDDGVAVFLSCTVERADRRHAFGNYWKGPGVHPLQQALDGIAASEGTAASDVDDLDILTHQRDDAGRIVRVAGVSVTMVRILGSRPGDARRVTAQPPGRV